jgi:hypothetical protein
MRCVRALQTQRLEGSRPGELWSLYVDEPVLIVCEVAVAVGALRFQLLVAGRMVVGRRNGDRTTILHSEEYETQNQCVRRSAREKQG